MTQLPAVEKQEEHLRLRIFLQLKASKDQIVGLHGNELKITITAPPIDGQANAHLLKFLSKTFKVPKSSIVLEKGELNRHKQILIPNPKVIPEEIIALLK
ncbi:TPA: YggU family protein [Pasteurella multocida]|nr:YggU family protein [Pasteurella multocida]HDR1876179.1 YggU family protein [Pasteurella multocida]HDR1921602.1 YggU family protein [Pasteurella multocida]HDR1928918.1 YggU family protein [Pasteurella multocida]HED4463895.1 YggU family protein [Pasteurella multocida]